MDSGDFDRRMWEIFGTSEPPKHQVDDWMRRYVENLKDQLQDRDPLGRQWTDKPVQLSYPDAIDCESFEEGEEEPWWLWRLPEKSHTTLMQETAMRAIREDMQHRYAFGPLSINDPRTAFKITGITGC